jgi:hypothetical protein
MERLPELFERAKRYSVPNPPHGVKVKVQIMQRVKGAGDDLAGDKNVPKVRPREVPTGVTPARWISGPVVLGKACILDVEDAFAGEELAIPGVARWHHAIEHVHASSDTFDEVERSPDAH